MHQFLRQGRAGKHAATLQRYQQNAEFFVCSCIGKGHANVPRTPGGMMHHQRWNNLQFVTSASFLLTVYADYAATTSVRCPGGAARSFDVLAFVRSQVDYLLGDNPRATSYMVGYGASFPRQVHHRGASIVSVRKDPSFVSCAEGYAAWYPRQAGNPNLLEGAVVGGPDEYDDFADERNNYEQTEPATYNSAPLLGVLARLAEACGAGGMDEYYRSSLLHLQNSSWPISDRHRRRHAAWAPFQIEQNVTRTWARRGRNATTEYHRYSATVTNRSRKTVRELHLGVLELKGRLWGLDKARYGYVPPKWMPALHPGKSLSFVYVQAAPQATVWVTGYKLL
jgi:endoglucanase